MSESLLKPFSIGIVIEDKQRGSDHVKVSPMEQLPMQSGDMTQDKRSYETTTSDASGVKRSSKVEGSNFVIAKWFSQNSTNRLSAPDVYKGESVQLYRFADTDEYYWTCVFREPGLRKLETMLVGCSNNPGGGAFNRNSSYYAEVSTYDSHIAVHTSQSNGEPYGYDINIDAAQGVITIKDTVNNTITLDSRTNTIQFDAQAKVNINAPEVNIKATNINLEGQVKIKGGVEIDGTLKTTGQVSGDQGATFVQDVTAPNI